MFLQKCQGIYLGMPKKKFLEVLIKMLDDEKRTMKRH